MLPGLTFEAHSEPRYLIRNINHPIFKKTEITSQFDIFLKFEKSRLNAWVLFNPSVPFQFNYSWMRYCPPWKNFFKLLYANNSVKKYILCFLTKVVKLHLYCINSFVGGSRKVCTLQKPSGVLFVLC